MKVDITELYDLNSIQNNKRINYSECSIPLYHGTNLKAITASKDEITRMMKACLYIRKTLGKYYFSRKYDEDLRRYMNSEQGKVFRIALDGIGSSMFEHGSLYVTNSIYRASLYSFSGTFGEIGRMVKALIDAKNTFKESLVDNQLENEISYFSEHIKEYEEAERIIAVFENVSYKDLLSEGGKNIFMSGDTEYDKDNIDTLYEIPQRSYRLLNSEKYLAGIIHRTKFDEAVELLADDNDKRCYAMGKRARAVKRI